MLNCIVKHTFTKCCQLIWTKRSFDEGKENRFSGFHPES